MKSNWIYEPHLRAGPIPSNTLPTQKTNSVVVLVVFFFFVVVVDLFFLTVLCLSYFSPLLIFWLYIMFSDFAFMGFLWGGMCVSWCLYVFLVLFSLFFFSICFVLLFVSFHFILLLFCLVTHFIQERDRERHRDRQREKGCVFKLVKSWEWSGWSWGRGNYNKNIMYKMIFNLKNGFYIVS